jgi:hypothetical protein
LQSRAFRITNHVRRLFDVRLDSARIEAINMALFSRIYFNAVFGALGGLLGWMLFGLFLDQNRSDFRQWLQGGGGIGYFVVSVEAIRDRSLLRFCRLAAYGVILGAIGGGLGMCLGELVNTFIVGLLGADRKGGFAHLVGTTFARGLGWMFLGMAIGASEGIAARSLGKFSYGTLGGAIGGFVGGILFWLYYSHALRNQAAVLDPGASRSATLIPGALGLVVLGACIGSLSALVQGVFQPASVKVLRGWQEGREYALSKTDNRLGRDEHSDIALFRDMKVEKKHAIIQREGQRYLLLNNDAPSEWTRVNDNPVLQCCDLHDGDRIQLGNILLRFQLRAAQQRRRK